MIKVILSQAHDDRYSADKVDVVFDVLNEAYNFIDLVLKNSNDIKITIINNNEESEDEE